MEDTTTRIPANAEIRRLLHRASSALLAAADLAENSPDVYLEADVRALGTDVWLLNGGDDGDATDGMRLSRNFSAIIREWLSAEELIDVNILNAARNDDSCATHDFCDANEAMAEAFKKTFGRKPKLNSDADRAVWGEAWALSIDANFDN